MRNDPAIEVMRDNLIETLARRGPQPPETGPARRRYRVFAMRAETGLVWTIRPTVDVAG